MCKLVPWVRVKVQKTKKVFGAVLPKTLYKNVTKKLTITIMYLDDFIKVSPSLSSVINPVIVAETVTHCQ